MSRAPAASRARRVRKARRAARGRERPRPRRRRERVGRRVVIAHERRRDAEDARVQGGLGLEADAGARRHHVARPAGVLREIARELVAERGLEVREARAIARAQVDGVLVGRVGLGDRHDLALLELLGELAGKLHRRHAGAEEAADRTFDDPLESALDAAQDAQLTPPPVPASRPARRHRAHARPAPAV